MNRVSAVLLTLLLTPLLSGCPQLQGIRLGQDSPEMLESLIEQQEYARARQLTGRNPAIDTPEIQQRISTLESQYAEEILAQARTLESEKDLLGAVTLLTTGLEKVPHHEDMRSLRAEIESRRSHQLKINERDKLLARADYLIDQQNLYQRQTRLSEPGFMDRREMSRLEEESVDLARQLLEHARYARETGDDTAARTCLVLSIELNESIEAHDMLVNMLEVEQSNIRTAQQAIEKRRAEQARIKAQREKDVTEKLLETTREALKANQLRDARAALAKIPSSASTDSEVLATQDSVDKVIGKRVQELLVRGDAEYRAEEIVQALQTWNEALALQPDNKEIQERIERASKVLAKVEALKRQQQK